jgi:muconate/chloromuconate cycloisomerase
MKIEKIDVLQRSVPFKRPFEIAGGATTVCEHAIIRITIDDGTYGLGEAATMAAYSEETHTGVETVLKEKLIPVVIGCDPFDINAIMERLDKTVDGNSFAKAAIDLALHDLMGKLANQPVYKLLGGKYRDRVPLAWAIGLGGIGDVAAEAVEYVEKGYRTIKIKIGNDPKRDIDAVREVRNAIGDEIKFRVDANMGYDLDTAIETLSEMEKYDIELFEQPISRDDIEGMAKLCERFDTPIMADESNYSPEDALDLARKKAADILNIKIMKPCGLRGSRAIANIAQAADIPLLIGSMPEMGIGTAAGLHFAISTPGIEYACELIGPEMLADDVIEPVPFLKTCEKGYLELPTGNGLGVDLRE